MLFYIMNYTKNKAILYILLIILIIHIINFIAIDDFESIGFLVASAILASEFNKNKTCPNFDLEKFLTTIYSQEN